MASYTCPTCRKRIEVIRKEDAPYRPFCCEKCKLLDLAKWFNEEYRIEVPLTPAEGQNPAPAPPENET